MNLNIQISDDKEIDLTEDEAKLLFLKLQEVFGTKEKNNWWPITYPNYPIYPNYPTYTSPSVPSDPLPDEYPVITCTTEGRAKVSVVYQWEEPRYTNVEITLTTSDTKSVNWDYYGGFRL